MIDLPILSPETDSPQGDRSGADMADSPSAIALPGLAVLVGSPRRIEPEGA